MVNQINKINSLNRPVGETDKITFERFILFNLGFVFLVAVVVNLSHYFPQIKPEAAISPGLQAAGSQASQPSEQSQKWQAGAFRKQIDEQQQDFIDQIERLDVAAQVDSVGRLQQPLTKQEAYQNPIKGILREDCYSDCRMQDDRNNQFCQSRCTY